MHMLLVPSVQGVPSSTVSPQLAMIVSSTSVQNRRQGLSARRGERERECREILCPPAALTLIEEWQPLVGGSLVANVVIARTLLRPEAWLLRRTRLLATDLIALAFPNTEDATVCRHGRVAFPLLDGDTAATAARAFAPLAPIAPATIYERQLILAHAFPILAPLALAAGGARRCGSHIGHTFPIDATPQRRAELMRRRAGAHIAVRGQVELHAALPLRIVKLARQQLRILVLIESCGRIIQAFAQSLAINQEAQ